MRLGDIAITADHDAARSRFEEALPLYHRLGDFVGEANCIQRLGDIALARSDHDTARSRFAAALALYDGIKEPYSIGWTHRRLAQMTTGEERVHHLLASAAEWRRIGRNDLVAELMNEVGS
jgi:hypothetical protein